MLELLIDKDVVNAWVTSQHLGVVRVYQRSNLGVPVMQSKCGKCRRGANQITDVIPPDDQNTWLFR
jgi:predicted RNA-binding protein with PUA domain